MSSTYLYLLIDSFLSGFILTFHDFFYYTVITAWGHFNQPLVTAVTVIGATVGSIATYYLGRGIRHFRLLEKQQLYFSDYSAFAKKWLFWTVLFVWIPFGGAIVFFAGIFEISLRRVALLISLGYAGYFTALSLYFY